VLTAGLPTELVQAITGHKTVEIALKHFFKLKPANLRAQVEKMMPALLPPAMPGGEDSANVMNLLAGATKANAWEVLQRLKGLVG